MRSTTQALLFAFAALACAAGVHADDNKYRNLECKAVRGMLVPECNAAICNQGRVTGDLAGRFTSRRTSIYPAGSGWLFTAWTRIELDGGKGRIETIDEGTTPRDAQGGPDESQVMQILTLDQATGQYQDYVGTIILTGAHEVGKPAPYAGRMCRPMQRG